MNPIHATCVAIDGRGVLLVGPSGSGKSDLALRLIDRGALLVSDDYTALAVEGDRLFATAPATIAGRIEIRGIGIIALEAMPRTVVSLVIDAGDPERMPASATWAKDGVVLPRLCLALLEPSAPLKVELALRATP